MQIYIIIHNHKPYFSLKIISHFASQHHAGLANQPKRRLTALITAQSQKPREINFIKKQSGYFHIFASY